MNDLEARARKAIAQASVLAEAPGVSFIPSGHAKHESKDPTTGAGGNTLDRVVWRISDGRERGPRSFERAVVWAEREIQRTKHPPKKITGRAKDLMDTEGMSCAEAAAELGTHHTTIWRWRLKAGRHSSCGHPHFAAEESCSLCSRAGRRLAS